MDRWRPPRPEASVYLVGDIHGSAERLQRLLEKLDDDLAASGDRSAQIVFLGDYVDRGDDSRDILTFLRELSAEEPDLVTCLAGNHEDMLLAFLDDPMGSAKRWLRYGGIQTLASYGVRLPASAEKPTTAELLDLAGDLRAAMGDDLIAWLRDLPLSWNSGDVWAVHAGADPDRAMSDQSRKTLLWGHDAFFTRDRSDGQWVSVGHQPFETPDAANGRITVDTGAVYGGPLTAAKVTPDVQVQFLQAA